MGDQKLLELAAKAAGLRVIGKGFRGVGLMVETEGCKSGCQWNPLVDDGDALRLAVELKISLVRHKRRDWDCLPWIKTSVLVEGSDSTYIQLPLRTKHDSKRAKIDNCRVYRRAIVTAAAELGKRVEREERRESRVAS